MTTHSESKNKASRAAAAIMAVALLLAGLGASRRPFESDDVAQPAAIAGSN